MSARLRHKKTVGLCPAVILSLVRTNLLYAVSSNSISSYSVSSYSVSSNSVNSCD